MLELIANWRAGCGRSASPVRREGERKSMRSPYPYQLKALSCDVGILLRIYRRGDKKYFLKYFSSNV